jgi:nicotinamidase-related amidase
MPDLAELVPPAMTFDKSHYSPWIGGRLRTELESRAVDTVLITGGETDVCVIATVLGAVDHGYRVIVVPDALCSSSDEAHDAALRIFMQRFSRQIEVADAEEVLACRRLVNSPQKWALKIPHFVASSVRS